MKGLALTAAAVIFLAGCVPQPEEPLSVRTFTDLARELYVINEQAETVSVIDLDTREMYSDAFLSGVWPNHIVFHRDSIYMVNSGDNNVTVYDESTFATLGEIYLDTGSNPWMIIHKEGTDKGYIPNFTAGDVAVVDLYTLDILERIPVGNGPEGGAYQNGKVYVGNTAWNYQEYDFDPGTVSVIDTVSDEVLTTITVEKNPQSIIAFPDLNEIHVVCTGKNGGDGSDDGRIVVVDTNTDEVTEILEIGGSPVGGSQGVDSTHKIAYLVGIGGLQSYNYETKTVLHDSADYIIIGDDPDNDLFSGVAVDETEGCLYVSHFTGDRVLVLDWEDYSLLEEIEGSDGTSSLYIFTE